MAQGPRVGLSNDSALNPIGCDVCGRAPRLGPSLRGKYKLKGGGYGVAELGGDLTTKHTKDTKRGRTEAGTAERRKAEVGSTEGERERLRERERGGGAAEGGGACYFSDAKPSLRRPLYRGLVEYRLKLCGGVHHFIKGGCGTKEHRAKHFLVVGAPVGDMRGGRREAEGAGLVGSVVHP